MGFKCPHCKRAASHDRHTRIEAFLKIALNCLFFSQQPLDRFLELWNRIWVTIRDFSSMNFSDYAFFIDQVKRGPVLIIVSFPGFFLIVLKDRPGHTIALHGVFHATQVLVALEFRGVNADDLESLSFVFGVPFFEGRQAVMAIDARMYPNVDDRHLAAQVFDRQRFAVGPSPARLKFGSQFGLRRATIGQSRDQQSRNR
jgi:hypothetical protein